MSYLVKQISIVFCLFLLGSSFQACAVENLPADNVVATETTDLSSKSDHSPKNQTDVPRDQFQEWSIDFERSGGFAGVQQSLTITSVGQLVVYENREQIYQAQISSREMEQITTHLKAAYPFETDQVTRQLPDNCPDCFQYSLEIKLDGQRYAIGLNDDSLPDSEFSPLVDKLVVFLQSSD